MHGGSVALVCLVLLGLALLPLGESSTSSQDGKCCAAVLDRIKQLQCKQGRPGLILEKFTDRKYYIVVITTSNKDYNRSDIDCYYSKVNSDSNGESTITYYRVWTNGTTTSKDRPVKEHCGSYYVPSLDVFRYVVVFEVDKYSVEYSCTSEKSDSDDSKPTMVVKAAEGYSLSDADKEDINEVCRKVAGFGCFDDSHDYTAKCLACLSA